MGYLKTIPIDTLPLPSNPEFHVRMRARGFFGVSREAQAAMIQADGIDPQTNEAITRSEWGDYVKTLLLGNPRKGVPGLLVDWNLTDENDMPLPLTLENLNQLDPIDGQFLTEEANKRNQLRGKVAEGNFATPS